MQTGARRHPRIFLHLSSLKISAEHLVHAAAPKFPNSSVSLYLLTANRSINPACILLYDQITHPLFFSHPPTLPFPSLSLPLCPFFPSLTPSAPGEGLSWLGDSVGLVFYHSLCRKAQTGSGQMKALYLLLVLNSHLAHSPSLRPSPVFFFFFYLCCSFSHLFFSSHILSSRLLLPVRAISCFLFLYHAVLFTLIPFRLWGWLTTKGKHGFLACLFRVDSESSSHQTGLLHMPMRPAFLCLTMMSNATATSLGSVHLMQGRKAIDNLQWNESRTMSRGTWEWGLSEATLWLTEKWYQSWCLVPCGNLTTVYLLSLCLRVPVSEMAREKENWNTQTHTHTGGMCMHIKVRQSAHANSVASSDKAEFRLEVKCLIHPINVFCQRILSLQSHLRKGVYTCRWHVTGIQ